LRTVFVVPIVNKFFALNFVDPAIIIRIWYGKYRVHLLDGGSVRRGLSSYPRQVFSKDDRVGIVIYAHLSAVQFANVIEGKAREKDDASVVVPLQQDNSDESFLWKIKRLYFH